MNRRAYEGIGSTNIDRPEAKKTTFDAPNAVELNEGTRVML